MYVFQLLGMQCNSWWLLKSETCPNWLGISGTQLRYWIMDQLCQVLTAEAGPAKEFILQL